MTNRNTNYEYFTFNDIQYRRQFFQRLFWYKKKINFPHRSTWAYISDESKSNELESMYETHIFSEERIKKLKKLTDE